jgi:hypothetical protein
LKEDGSFEEQLAPCSKARPSRSIAVVGKEKSDVLVPRFRRTKHRLCRGGGHCALLFPFLLDVLLSPRLIAG